MGHISKTLLVLDAIFVIFSFITAFTFRHSLASEIGFNTQPLSFYALYLPFLLLIFFLVSISLKLFTVHHTDNNRFFSSVYNIAKTLLIYSLLAMISFYLLKIPFSRTIFLSALVLIFVFLSTIHGIFAISKKDQNKNKITLYLNDEGGKTAFDYFKNFPRPIDYDHLIKNLVFYNPSEIIIKGGYLTHEEILTLISSYPSYSTKFTIESSVFKLILPTNSITVYRRPPSIVFNLTKKSFDFLLGLILAIILMPIFILIAIAIKIESNGRAIIRQRRIGLEGKPFIMYKFRSMYSKDAVYEPAPVKENDKRITAVGKLLRKTSMDELPQIFNVLKGEMSFVGPRPEMDFIVEQYKPWQMKRFDVKPGITGLWQVSGRKDLPLHQNLEYDLYYILNRGLLLDGKILLKTIPVVLSRKGAY